MSGFFSSRFLEQQKPRKVAGLPIDDDRACRNCGYNLRGLMTDKACPECGTPISEPRRRVDVFSAADTSTRKAVSLGLALLGWSVLIAAVARMALAITLVGTRDYVQGYLVLITFNALAWTVGACILTGPVMDRVHRRARKLRLIARGLQFLWFPAFGCWFVRTLDLSNSPTEGTLDIFCDVLRFFAGCGVMILLFLLRLA
ncbi:MAG TPA: hypothetical protein VG711_12455, partial [Phycisphaerales bacterium]|nr:hypothetical protein [Phycisphaerales bacterium]